MDLELTPDQQKAFSKLVAAYKGCKKAGIYFANLYGSLQAYDSKIVAGYGNSEDYDADDEDVLPALEASTAYSLDIENEWCDDEGSHLVKLTSKGLALLQDADD